MKLFFLLERPLTNDLGTAETVWQLRQAMIFMSRQSLHLARRAAVERVPLGEQGYAVEELPDSSAWLMN